MKVHSIKNLIAVFVFTFSLAFMCSQKTDIVSKSETLVSTSSQAFAVGGYLYSKNGGSAEGGLAISLVGCWESALYGFCFGGGVGLAVGV